MASAGVAGIETLGTPAAPDYDRLNPHYFQRFESILSDLKARGVFAEIMVFNLYEQPFKDRRIWTAAREQLWAQYQNTIVGSMGSFRRLTDTKILQVQPMHLKIVTVKQSSTLGQLAKQEGSPVQLETLAIINQTEANAGFKVGDRVKMVIGVMLGTE